VSQHRACSFHRSLFPQTMKKPHSARGPALATVRPGLRSASAMKSFVSTQTPSSQPMAQRHSLLNVSGQSCRSSHLIGAARYHVVQSKHRILKTSRSKLHCCLEYRRINFAFEYIHSGGCVVACRRARNVLSSPRTGQALPTRCPSCSRTSESRSRQRSRS
jgi:hypothetical protein